MKLNYKLVLTVVSLGALLTASCQKETLDQAPQASLSAAGAIKDASTVNAATLGIYSGFQSGNYWGLRYFAFSDLYADNINHTGTFPSFSQIWNVAILPDNTEVSAMWNSMYSTINRANTVIAAVPGIADPTLVKDNAIAEARILRANVYFDLIRYWGGSKTGFNKAGGVGVPLILTPTLTEADAAPKLRATEAAVMGQVIADLDFAIGVSTFSNINATTGRVGKDYAKALRARVALYMGDYATALTYSNELIASGRYTLTPGATYKDIWANKNTKESLWEIQYEPTNSNSIAFFYYSTATGGRNEIASSGGLNTAHEAGDLRKSVNATTTGGTATNLKTLKFTRVGTGDDNVVMFRLSELYLIRAEARAMGTAPDLVNALADLNVVRARAGLAASAAATAPDLLTDILKERRIELAHEGHRFFDLKRTNLLASTIGAAYFGITTSDNTFRALWPIPQREVLTSGGIIAQNTGY